MTTSTDFLTPLAVGFGRLLGDAGIGLTWSDTGDYVDSDSWPIHVLAVPLAPPAVVTISPYVLTEAPVYTDTTVGVQIRYRSATEDIRPMWSVRDAVRAYLRGRFPLRLPTGAHVWALSYTSGASLGQNDQHRWEWADNWAARVGVIHPTT